MDQLTPRERDILVCLPLTNCQIGRRLNISERTVKAHLTTIYSKLDMPKTTSQKRWMALVRALKRCVITESEIVIDKPRRKVDRY